MDNKYNSYIVNIIREDINSGDRYLKSQQIREDDINLLRRSYIDNGYERYEPTESETTFPIPDTIVYVKSVSLSEKEYVYVSKTPVDSTNVLFNMKEHNDKLWDAKFCTDGVIYKHK